MIDHRCLGPQFERRDFDHLVQVLKGGGVAIVPTDTCFALVGDALNQSVVQRVLNIKHRDNTDVPAVFVPGIESANRFVSISDAMGSILKRLLPGPVTVLLKPSNRAPQWLVGPDGLIGIRYIDFYSITELLKATGLLLTATSANLHGHSPPYEPGDLESHPVSKEVDVVWSAACGGLPQSSVVDLSSGRLRIIREGAVTSEELLNITREHQI